MAETMTNTKCYNKQADDCAGIVQAEKHAKTMYKNILIN